MNLIGIKTPRGLYISDNVLGKDYHSGSLKGMRVNGTKGIPTFHKDWLLAEGAEDVATFTMMKKQKRTNHRFVLIDEAMASDKIPLILTADAPTTFKQVFKTDYAIAKEEFSPQQEFEAFKESLPIATEEETKALINEILDLDDTD